MIRKGKKLGLVVLAALAVAAVMAPAASAALFNAEEKPVTITGGQTTGHVFTTDVGPVTCSTASFHGEAKVVSTFETTITPTYGNCILKTVFGTIAVTVNFNGCDYLLTADREVHIKCPEGKNVVISGIGCTVTVPPQTIVNGVEYTNEGVGATRDILVHATASGITYSYTGFTCGSGTNTNNGLYTGTTTLSGSKPGEPTKHIGIWHLPN